MSLEIGFLIKKIVSAILMPLPIGLIVGVLGLLYLYQNRIKKAKIFLSFSLLWITIVTSAPFIDYNTGTIEPTVTFCQTTGVGSLSSESEINIYPNPASSDIYIDSDGALKNVKILNSLGQVLINTNNSNIEINSLSTGVYIVVIETEYTTVKRKLIVE